MCVCAKNKVKIQKLNFETALLFGTLKNASLADSSML